MMLSKSAWIYEGSGVLYSSPFVTRCLLYRLHDVNSSILIYHEPNVTSVDASDKTSPNIHVFHTVCHQVNEVFVHYVNSSVTPLKDLVHSPSIQLKLSDSLRPQCAFGEIGVKVERFHLPCKEMLAAFRGQGSRFECQISETPYRVRGLEVSLHKIGSKSEMQEVQMHIWRLTIGDFSKKEYYDYSGSREWSLTALDIEEGWTVVSEMHLEQRQ